jgi:hypothetical protein
MPKQVLALKLTTIPPLELGTSWTGRTLLSFIVANASPEEKAGLMAMFEHLGPDRFKGVFNEKAEELNARAEARVLDQRTVKESELN